MKGDAETEMNGRRSKDELEDHIRATQDDLRQTIEAIGESLSVGEMLDAAAYYLRVGPGEFGASLGRSARDNPIAVSLLGAGLAWLMLSPETKERARRATSSAAEGAAEQSASSREGARRGAERAREFAKEEPIVVAMAGLFAGSALAAALPRSETEERLVGSRAHEVVTEAAETARGAARAAAEGVRRGFEGDARERSEGGARDRSEPDG